MISCEYCEVDCKASDVEAHQEICGSRTDECPTCGHFVLVRMLKTHMALHEKKSTTNHPGHGSNPTAAGHTIVKSRNVTVQKMLAAHSHVPVSKPPTGAETLVTIRANYTDAFDDLFVGENPSGFTEPENVYDDELPKVACEICQKEVTIYELNDHERQCSQNLENYLEADPQDQLHKQLAARDHENHFESKFETRVVERSSHAEPWANETEESSLPCEICGTLFPLEFLVGITVVCFFEFLYILTLKFRNCIKSHANLLKRQFQYPNRHSSHLSSQPLSLNWLRKIIRWKFRANSAEC